MRTRTKIICTIGPAVRSYEKIVELIDSGMDVARLNFSHGSHAEHAEVVGWLKSAREKRGVPLAIMLDTKGPEIRVGAIKAGKVLLQEGSEIEIVKEEIEGDERQLMITPLIAVDALEIGTEVLFDDGYITTVVIARSERGVKVRVLNTGVLKSYKGVNIPSLDIGLPAMTEQDHADIRLGCLLDIDWIAASFIRSAEHILEIKKLLIEENKPDILILAKIENSLGVRNFNEIVQVADGIMVARGDLGVELPLKEVPKLQKMMIRTCYLVGKPVITATQMLESMIHNPRPTRAEVSDVANAIYDSTSAVMLSGETAVGAYPIEAVKMMRSIIEATEKDVDYKQFHDVTIDYKDIATSIALATVKTAYSSQAQAIFVLTSCGRTARLVSKFRPEMAIVALSPYEKIYHQLAMSWGVIPVKPYTVHDIQEGFHISCHYALELGIVLPGDLVVITAGSPFGVSGTTNMMLVESVGNAPIN